MGSQCVKPADEKHGYQFLTKLPSRTARFREPKAITMPTKDKLMNSIHDPSIDDTWRILQDARFSDVHEVTKHLFLTSLFGMNRDDMAKKGITWIINATTEMPRFKQFKQTTLRVPVTDDRGEDIYPFLDHVADAVHELISHEENVVVHCQAGVSRSTVIVLAYLIKYEKRSLRNAYNLVLEKRPVVRPNTTFLHALVKFEREHLPNLQPKHKTVIIQVKKNEKLVEVPNWLWYDQNEKFDEEFSSNRQMNIAPYRDETKVFVDLDQEPAYFANHEADILGDDASSRFKALKSFRKPQTSITPVSHAIPVSDATAATSHLASTPSMPLAEFVNSVNAAGMPPSAPPLVLQQKPLMPVATAKVPKAGAKGSDHAAKPQTAATPVSVHESRATVPQYVPKMTSVDSCMTRFDPHAAPQPFPADRRIPFLSSPDKSSVKLPVQPLTPAVPASTHGVKKPLTPVKAKAPPAGKKGSEHATKAHTATTPVASHVADTSIPRGYVSTIPEMLLKSPIRRFDPNGPYQPTVFLPSLRRPVEPSVKLPLQPVTHVTHVIPVSPLGEKKPLTPVIKGKSPPVVEKNKAAGHAPKQPAATKHEVRKPLHDDKKNNNDKGKKASPGKGKPAHRSPRHK